MVDEITVILDRFGVSRSDYHLQNLIFHGFSVEGEDAFHRDLRKASPFDRYKRVHFTWDSQRFHTRQKPIGESPYHYSGSQLLFRQLEPVKEFRYEPKEIDGSLLNWYFKPEPKGHNPFWELRLNPINGCSNLKHRTGSNLQFRGCAFCHRMYDFQSRSENQRMIVSPRKMFEEIFEAHSPSVIAQVDKALLVTGDAKTPEEMLEVAIEIHEDFLLPHNFSGTYSVVTSQFTSEQQIERLSQLDNHIFEYTIECFDRREEILGPRKGRPMEEVLDTLQIARKYFEYTRVNYVVGLDDLQTTKKWFRYLADADLIDDTIAMAMTPFSPAMEHLRCAECIDMGVAFVFEVAEFLEVLGLWTRRLGVEKSIFSSRRLGGSTSKDEFLRNASTGAT